MAKNSTRYPSPPTLTGDAFAFLALRPDRPGYFALYKPSGVLSNTFAHDLTVQDIMALCDIDLDWDETTRTWFARPYQKP